MCTLSCLATKLGQDRVGMILGVSFGIEVRLIFHSEVRETINFRLTTMLTRKHASWFAGSFYEGIPTFRLATYRLLAARDGLLGNRECEKLIDGREMQHR